MQQEGEYERPRWHGQNLTNWAPEYEKVGRSKPLRFELGLVRVEVVPALAHGAMGHGLLKPIVSASCARAKGGGQGALRFFEMAKRVVARVTSRIDVCTGLKIEAVLGQDTASRRKTCRNAASGTIELERCSARARERRGIPAGLHRRKSSGARSQVCQSVSGPTRRPSCA